MDNHTLAAVIAMGKKYAGEITNNISADIAQNVSSWLDDHVDPDTGYVIDNTLTIQGAAADAKAVGDANAELKSQLLQHQASIEDILLTKVLTDAQKNAILACFRNVAWINDQGQTYYTALQNAFDVSVTSISAVYTQSGTVYDTQTLDDLRQNLVVTANYSDGTTQTVTSYTLSGTLAVGTSTITASYNEKTTTFNVTVTERETPSIIYSLPRPTTFNGTSDYVDTGVQLMGANKSNLTIAVDYLDQNIASPSVGGRYAFLHVMHEASPYAGFSVMDTYRSDNVFNVVWTINSDTTAASERYTSLNTSTSARVKMVITIDFTSNKMNIYALMKDVSVNKSVDIPTDMLTTTVAENLLIGCYQTTDGTKGRFFKATVYDAKVYSYAFNATEANAYLQEDHS